MNSVIIDRADRPTVAAVAAVPADMAGIEEDVPGVVRVVRIEGRRTVVAVGPRIVDAAVDPEASGGKEDTITVGTGYQSSLYSVLCRPGPGTIVTQLRPLCIRRHSPIAVQIDAGRIVLQVKNGLVVHRLGTIPI